MNETFEIQNKEFLAHHGRKGQRWGKKNGPPYPLDYDQLSDKERAEAKQKAIETGNTKEAYANRKHFSNQEIDALILRYNKEHQLMSLVPKDDVKTGLDKFEDMMKVAGRVGTAVENGTRGYNAAAKVLNSVVGTDLPLIENKQDQSKDKNKIKNDILKNKQLEATIEKSKAEAKKIEEEAKKTRIENKKAKKAGDSQEFELEKIKLQNEHDKQINDAKVQAELSKTKSQYEDAQAKRDYDKEVKKMEQEFKRENNEQVAALQKELSSVRQQLNEQISETERFVNSSNNAYTNRAMNSSVNDSYNRTNSEWYYEMYERYDDNPKPPKVIYL